MILTVGELRQQTALSDTNISVEIVPIFTNKVDIKSLKVVRCYPDTIDTKGNWNSSFKIEVEIE